MHKRCDFGQGCDCDFPKWPAGAKAVSLYGVWIVRLEAARFHGAASVRVRAGQVNRSHRSIVGLRHAKRYDCGQGCDCDFPKWPAAAKAATLYGVWIVRLEAARFHGAASVRGKGRPKSIVVEDKRCDGRQEFDCGFPQWPLDSG